MRWLQRCSIGFTTLLLLSCSGAETPDNITFSEGSGADISTSISGADSFGDVGDSETMSSSGTGSGSGESGDTTGARPGDVPGVPGDPCTEDMACEGYCNIEDGERSGTCVEACPDGICPDGFVCLSIDTESGPQDACLPAPDTFCVSCASSVECGDASDICAPLAGGNFCLIDCTQDPDICPPGFSCGLIGSVDDGTVVQQCVPDNSICCVDGDGDIYGEGGGCLGTDCDDSNPDVYASAPELCDGADNDCDDLVDNDVIDCGVASCELGSLGYFQTAAEACTDGACEGGDTSLCGLYTCVDGGSDGDSCATSCDGEDDLKCIPAAHCDASVCLDDLADGQGCDEQSDCVSDYCSGGFCCAGGDCCQQASDCPTFGTDDPICTTPASCQGTKGEAVCGANFICSNTGTEEDDSACDATTEANDCGPYLSVFCNGDVDQTAPACATSCNSDADCDADAHCDASNTCQPDLDDGEACGASSWCVSGNCNNGFCCDSGDCCQQASDCPASYSSPSSCTDPANCQGTRDDATCVTNICGTLTGVADDSACDASVEANTCGLYVSQFCNGAESQNSPACGTACGSDADCDANAYCNDSNLCVPDEPNGDPCGGAGQCQSGYCANGFCCDGGECCGANTDCAQFDQASACNDAATCQGTRVDGICQANFQCAPATVDDDSGCVGLGTDDCGLYPSVACTSEVDQNSPACATTCVNDSDCDAAAFCDQGVCAPDGTLGTPCTVDNECGAGLVCADGVCCDGVCDGTCEACNLAGSVGTCSPVADGDDPAGECGSVSCGGYYFGWVGDTCYERANVADGACNGAGACQDAASLCPSQGQGASSASCDVVCQDPDPATCTGTTAPVCDAVTPASNTQTCGEGVCQVTTEICNNGAPVTCTPDSGAATTEVCDGLDNDCNPATADGSGEANFGAACDGSDSDACEDGVFICNGVSLVCNDDAAGVPDLCNNTDDDCDPLTPDGADEPSLGIACDSTDDTDLCEEGVVICSGGALTCTDDAASIAELCDGADNDCNPLTPDGNDEANFGAACDGADSDECEDGTFICDGATMVCSDDAAGVPDICNGTDDDCNPLTADGVDDPLLGQACDGTDTDLCEDGVNVCSSGSIACSDDASSVVEICNGLDDDCNGLADDQDACPCPVYRNNGRLYQLCDNTSPSVGGGKIWAEADAACVGSGPSGYRLATVSDQAENDYLFGLIEAYLQSFNQGKAQADERYFWIGGTDFCVDDGSCTGSDDCCDASGATFACAGNCCEGTWTWTSGDAFDTCGTTTYTNWYVQDDGSGGDPVATEPNNAGGNEHVTEFGRFYGVNDVSRRSGWNDADGGNINFYICEYNP